MAVCSYQDLLTDNAFLCYPYHVHLAMEVQMLCNLLDKIANGGAVTCDPGTLLDQGKCFVALPDSVLQAIKLQLLCEISNAL
jgi:hypothetical protein